MNTARLLTVLALSGYRVDPREHGFTEVLVSNADERWLGRGSNLDAALADVLTSMFPSALSRSLWLAHWAASGGEDEEHGGPEAPEPYAHVELAEPEPEPEPTPTPTPIKPSPPSPPPLPAPEPRPVPPHPPQAVPPRAESLCIVEEVTREFVETTDLALFAPHVMRLQLQAWMATARDAQDSTGVQVVESAVTKLAAAFGDVARTYWPGSVPALARAATPASVATGARSWRDVAAITEQRLTAVENVSATGRPLDSYGWLAGAEARLDPLPAQPHVHLRAAQALIESWFGRAILGPDVPPPGTSSARGAYFTALGSASSDMTPLHKAAALLRWCRTSTDNLQMWGQLMGWLRWIEGERRDHTLDDYLSPFYVPTQSWAECAGFILHRRVAPARPPVPAPTEDVIPWLRQYAQDMDQAQLHQHLYPLRDTLARLNDTGELKAELSGNDLRGLRSKLRKLLQRNFEGISTPAAPIAPEPVEQEKEATAPDTFGGAGPIVEARARVEGRRTLVVSNREDPHLQRQLTEGLGIDIIDWVAIDKNLTAIAKADAIRNGCYDLVLLATGFMGHSHEGILRDACRSAGIDYVRAGKCRLTGCALAILSHGIGA